MSTLKFTTTIIEEDLGDSMDMQKCPGAKAFRRSCPFPEYKELPSGWVGDTDYQVNWSSYRNNKPFYMFNAEVGDVVTFKYVGE